MAELFSRHCQYYEMHQLLSVPVTAKFKNCLYFLIHPHMNTQPQNKSVYKKKKDLLWEEGRNP